MERKSAKKLMSIKARVAKLHRHHHVLREKISDELKRPAPCSTALQQLKRRRLFVKDQIAHYDGLLRTLGVSAQSQSV